LQAVEATSLLALERLLGEAVRAGRTALVATPAHLAAGIGSGEGLRGVCGGSAGSAAKLEPLASFWPHVSTEWWPPSVREARLGVYAVECG
jgi:hypothetical protein